MIFTGYFQQVKPRRRIEDRFSKLNVLIVSIQIAAFGYGLLNIMSYISSTTSSSYGSANFKYSNEATSNDQNCFNKTNGSLTHVSTANGQRYSAEVTTAYAQVLWNRSLGAAMSFIFFNSCVVGLSIVNKVWFEFGRHAIRFRSLVLHQNVLVTAEFVCAVMSLVSMSDALQLRQLPRRWLDGCDDSGRFNVVLSAPSYPLYAAIVIDLLAIAMSLALYAYYGWRRCRLDYEILDIKVGDAEVLQKRPLHILKNNEPRKHDRPYIEAYKRILEGSVGPDRRSGTYLTVDPNVVATLAEDDRERERERQERRRQSQREIAVTGGSPPSPPPQAFWDQVRARMQQPQQPVSGLHQPNSHASTAAGSPNIIDSASNQQRQGGLRERGGNFSSPLGNPYTTNNSTVAGERDPYPAGGNAQQSRLYNQQQQGADYAHHSLPIQTQAQSEQAQQTPRQGPLPPAGTVSTTYRGYSPAPSAAVALPPRRQRRVGGAGVVGGQVFSFDQ